MQHTSFTLTFPSTHFKAQGNPSFLNIAFIPKYYFSTVDWAPNINKMFQRPKMLQYLSHIRKELVVGSLWKFLRGLIREKQLHGFPKDCPQQICAAVLLPGQMKH